MGAQKFVLLPRRHAADPVTCAPYRTHTHTPQHERRRHLPSAPSLCPLPASSSTCGCRLERWPPAAFGAGCFDLVFAAFPSPRPLAGAAAASSLLTASLLLRRGAAAALVEEVREEGVGEEGGREEADGRRGKGLSAEPFLWWLRLAGGAGAGAGAAGAAAAESSAPLMSPSGGSGG